MNMITIPQAEYEALIAARDTLADLQAYDRAKAALDLGEEELLPASFVDRILDGEKPLRVWRDYRGFTQLALGEAAGVNRVVIADIESGKSTGSVATLKKLSSALGIALDDLVD